MIDERQLDLVRQRQKLSGPSAYFNAARLTGPGSPYYNAAGIVGSFTGPRSHYFNSTVPGPNIRQMIRDVGAGLIGPQLRDQVAKAVASQPPAIEPLRTRMFAPTIRDHLAKTISGLSPIDQMRMGVAVPSPYSQLAKTISGLSPIDQMRMGAIGQPDIRQLTTFKAGHWTFDQYARGLSGAVQTHQATADLSDELTAAAVGRDDEFVVVDDPDAANFLLRWLRHPRPTPRQIASLCRWLALLHAVIIVAQWKAGLELAPAIERLEIESELFLALIGFVLPLE